MGLDKEVRNDFLQRLEHVQVGFSHLGFSTVEEGGDFLLKKFAFNQESHTCKTTWQIFKRKIVCGLLNSFFFFLRLREEKKFSSCVLIRVSDSISG